MWEFWGNVTNIGRHARFQITPMYPVGRASRLGKWEFRGGNARCVMLRKVRPARNSNAADKEDVLELRYRWGCKSHLRLTRYDIRDTLATAELRRRIRKGQ